MRTGHPDPRDPTIVWFGQYLSWQLAALLTAMVASLAQPWLAIGAPVVLTCLVGWRAMEAASRDAIALLARIVMIGLLAFSALMAIFVSAAWHHHRYCADKASGVYCTSVAPPIIRHFDRFRPEYRPDILANP